MDTSLLLNQTGYGLNNTTRNFTAIYINQTFNTSLEDTEWGLPDWFTSTMSGANCVLFTIGSLGNIAILTAVIRSDKTSRPYNVLIIALAISDLLALTTNSVNLLPLLEITSVDVTAVTVSTCQLFLSVRTTVVAMSISFVALICSERFVAVTYPLKFKLDVARKFTFVSLCICIVVDLIAGLLPPAFYSQVDNGQCRLNANSNDNISHTPFIASLYTVVMVIPFILIVTLTPVILYKLYQQRIARSALISQERTGRFKTTLMLITVVVAFVVLYCIPTMLYLILNLEWLETESETDAIARIGIITCLQLNHSINFLLYGITNEEVREQLFCQFECCKRGNCLAEEKKQGIPANEAGDIEMQNMTTDQSP